MPRILKEMDWILVIAAVGLSAIGVLLVASLNYTSLAEAWGSPLMRTQLLWLGLGVVLMFGVALVDYRYLRRVSRVLYVIALALLVAVFFAGVAAGGATRWLDLGFLQLQPSEIVKVIIVVTLANQIARRQGKERPASWGDLVWSGLHVLVPAVLVLIQPDLGTSLVFAAILMGELFLTGHNPFQLVLLSVMGLGSAIGLVVANVSYGVEIFFLKPHMVARLISFIDPAADPTGAGYQLQQSIIAIGSGGFAGNGLFRGMTAQLSFLPEQHTDFVFSALGHQLGFVGIVLVMSLFLILFMRMFSIAINTHDVFGLGIVAGVISLLFFHVIVNAGMSVGIMPVTGLPLPFISYGRSAFLAEMVGVGLVLNVALHKSDIRFGVG